jgi:hypothetical protein
VAIRGSKLEIHHQDWNLVRLAIVAASQWLACPKSGVSTNRPKLGKLANKLIVAVFRSICLTWLQFDLIEFGELHMRDCCSQSPALRPLQKFAVN